MSHFTVLVIGANPEAQLAPFDENLSVEFVDTTEEYLKKYETEGQEMVKMEDGSLVSPYDECFRVGGIFGEKVVPEHLERLEIPHKEKYTTFEEFCRDWHGSEPNEEGRYGYWTNPDAKWDWYKLGGRWREYFKVKSSYYGPVDVGNRSLFDDPVIKIGPSGVDQILKMGIDFDGMRDEAVNKANKKWEDIRDIIGHLPIAKPWKQVLEEYPDVNEARVFYHSQDRVKALQASKEYRWEDLEPYQIPFEKYIQRARDSAISTFAVLKDGEWYERGKMGWWGMVNDEKDRDEWNAEFNRLIEELPEDSLLSVFDCHI